MAALALPKSRGSVRSVRKPCLYHGHQLMTRSFDGAGLEPI